MKTILKHWLNRVVGTYCVFSIAISHLKSWQMHKLQRELMASIKRKSECIARLWLAHILVNLHRSVWPKQYFKYLCFYCYCRPQSFNFQCHFASYLNYSSSLWLTMRFLGTRTRRAILRNTISKPQRVSVVETEGYLALNAQGTQWKPYNLRLYIQYNTPYVLFSLF